MVKSKVGIQHGYVMVIMEGGSWKLDLTCYAVHLAYWGHCLMFYMVRLTF